MNKLWNTTNSKQKIYKKWRKIWVLCLKMCFMFKKL